MEKTKKIRATAPMRRLLESILGCKWSLSVLASLGEGVHRPGALTRAIPGLTTKVLNERLRKLERFRLISRKVFPERPPRVEYRLTPFGRKFRHLLRAVDRLEAEWAASVSRTGAEPGFRPRGNGAAGTARE
jgi:DNA-binding HxlR family transcriptional regulator